MDNLRLFRSHDTLTIHHHLASSMMKIAAECGKKQNFMNKM